jgi:LAO/AO transport system kinase
VSARPRGGAAKGSSKRKAGSKAAPKVPETALAREVLAGDRRSLARAITLVESTRASHRTEARGLLDALLPHAGNAVRVGISGIPGVGKSTFIERFGMELIARGHRVAVLAVDPSSKRSGGSILGDKTRMEELSRHGAAFIRPSPTGGTLGGVARRTREAMLLCEAAGFDVVLVETVGVGQSETAVADMVDVFLLLLVPGGGDELQGLKKGIIELADLLVVNKADGELAAAAGRAAAEYKGALQLLRPASRHWRPPVLTCSALTGEGIAEVWETVEDCRRTLDDCGELAAKRAGQARSWMWSEVSETLLQAVREHPEIAGELAALEDEVMAGRTTPGAAAGRVLARFLGRED